MRRWRVRLTCRGVSCESCYAATPIVAPPPLRCRPWPANVTLPGRWRRRILEAPGADAACWLRAARAEHIPDFLVERFACHPADEVVAAAVASSPEVARRVGWGHRDAAVAAAVRRAAPEAFSVGALWATGDSECRAWACVRFTTVLNAFRLATVRHRYTYRMTPVRRGRGALPCRTQTGHLGSARRRAGRRRSRRVGPVGGR